MDGADLDGRQKRRLPPWMVGKAVVDQIGESAIGGKSNKNSLKEELASQACKPKSKARDRKTAKSPPLHEEENISSLVIERPARKKRKQKSSEPDADCDSGIYEVCSKRKKDKVVRTVPQSISQKTKKEKGFKVSCDGADATSLGEDNGELTMDDLMSIAEEYVKADGEMQLEQLSSTGHVPETELPATFSSRSEAGRSPDESAPPCNLAESLTEDTVVSHGRTGDPSQDMLDLFLGPLLKKPTKEGNKIGFALEDMEFSYESTKQNQSNSGGEEVIPLMKKKSSLKDKVALFLD